VRTCIEDVACPSCSLWDAPIFSDTRLNGMMQLDVFHGKTDLSPRSKLEMPARRNGERIAPEAGYIQYSVLRRTGCTERPVTTSFLASDLATFLSSPRASFHDLGSIQVTRRRPPPPTRTSNASSFAKIRRQKRGKRLARSRMGPIPRRRHGWTGSKRIDSWGRPPRTCDAPNTRVRIGKW
jgi:hypothetical protein